MSAEVNTVVGPTRRAALADYHVLAAYDARRTGRYGDMARSRRGRELDRLARELIAAGVPIDLDAKLTPNELVAAFERVGRPRLRRLERETAPVQTSLGRLDRRTRYNGTSLDTWRELERMIRGQATPPITLDLPDELVEFIDFERTHRWGKDELEDPKSRAEWIESLIAGHCKSVTSAREYIRRETEVGR